MFSKNMQAIYSRLMILGLLSMCLFVFGYSDKIESVSASSVCIQECEASEALCYDSCSTSCTPDSTDEECNGCIQSCQRSFGSCMRHAIWCSSGGSSYAVSDGDDSGSYSLRQSFTIASTPGLVMLTF